MRRKYSYQWDPKSTPKQGLMNINFSLAFKKFEIGLFLYLIVFLIKKAWNSLSIMTESLH